MPEWRVIDSGPCDAAYNMALDEAFAVFVRRGRSLPTLRLYGWETPSVSLGSFQKSGDIDFDYCSRRKIPVVRRLTGGRAVLHCDEFTYSFSSGNEGFFSHGLLESYRGLGLAFASALNMIGLEADMKTERETGRNLTRSPLCFRSSSYGEISVNAFKLVGSAQKRWSDGFLQQGSIPYSTDDRETAAVFRLDGPEERKSGRAEGDGYCRGLRDLLAGFDPETFKEAVKAAFERQFGVSLVDSCPSDQEQHLALQLAEEKYRELRWTLEPQGSRRFCSSSGRPRRA